MTGSEVFGSEVSGSEVFGSEVFGSEVFGSEVFGYEVFGSEVCVWLTSRAGQGLMDQAVQLDDREPMGRRCVTSHPVLCCDLTGSPLIHHFKEF